MNYTTDEVNNVVVMKKESITYLVVGLLAGFVIAGSVSALVVNQDVHSMMNMMGMTSLHSHGKEAESHQEMSMGQMDVELMKLSGEEYDKAFIEMMIVHHEGAVNMAKLSANRATHDEIKQLSAGVIAAQEKEIADMKQWQKTWGYQPDEMMDMMHDHR